jgi:hypothetical protein
MLLPALVAALVQTEEQVLNNVLANGRLPHVGNERMRLALNGGSTHERSQSICEGSHRVSSLCEFRP